jgi:hypothetical protein
MFGFHSTFTQLVQTYNSIQHLTVSRTAVCQAKYGIQTLMFPDQDLQ